MSQNEQRPQEPEEKPQGEGHLFLNAVKTVFLLAILVAAWFFLAWLFGRMK